MISLQSEENESTVNTTSGTNSSTTNNYSKYFTETDSGLDIDANHVEVGCLTSKKNTFHMDEEGNLTCNSINTNKSLEQKIDFNIIYPVGSIYMNVININPATFFGGQWEQIKDKFLLACGSTYTNGSTGGNASHTHSQGATGAAKGNTGSTTLTLEQIPSHNHGIQFTNTATAGSTQSRLGGGGTNMFNTANNGGGKGHVHTLNNHTHSNPNTNSSSNMPPYLVVYIWKRIS